MPTGTRLSHVSICRVAGIRAGGLSVEQRFFLKASEVTLTSEAFIYLSNVMFLFIVVLY